MTFDVVFEQNEENMDAEFNNVVVVRGSDGKSAYDIWVEQGNVGSPADFINSLKGEKYTLTEEDKQKIVDKVITDLPKWQGGSY